MFKLSRTFDDPGAGSNSQRGFPAPGEGAQTTGDWTPAPELVEWVPERPTKGRRSFFASKPSSRQRGFPSPENPAQRRPEGSMPNAVPQSGRAVEVWTPYYDRGAAAFVQNFGKVLTNPIGAGVVAPYRPQASYGPAGEYVNGAIWWVSQAVPTTVGLQGLSSPDVLASLLSETEVQAVIRVG